MLLLDTALNLMASNVVTTANTGVEIPRGNEAAIERLRRGV